MSALDDLWKVVATIPEGFVAAYSDVGRALPRPVSGVLVGKWMTQCPANVPWWRVVGRNGDLLLAKRGPEFAHEQKSRLLAEGVEFDGDQVAPGQFYVP